MKKAIFVALVAALSVVSYGQETPVVKKVKKQTSTVDPKNIKVVNEEDPVCHMKTKDHLKEVAVYEGKNYGFCSASCKKEFLKDPKKYLSPKK